MIGTGYAWLLEEVLGGAVGNTKAVHKRSGFCACCPLNLKAEPSGAERLPEGELVLSEQQRDWRLLFHYDSAFERLHLFLSLVFCFMKFSLNCWLWLTFCRKTIAMNKTSSKLGMMVLLRSGLRVYQSCFSEDETAAMTLSSYELLDHSWVWKGMQQAPVAVKRCWKGRSVRWCVEISRPLNSTISSYKRE